VRVNRYSVIIARFLGLDGQELQDIHVSSLLHDVGKIAIDDAILKKASPLTREEFEIIKTHTVRGAAIMAPIRPMKSIIPGLRHHHERCDGSGYPDALKREQTPLMARIIAVADTFDAITTDRPYQKGMGYERAVARINELKGPALDPVVVEAFNRACAAGEIRLDPEASPAVEVPAPPPSEVCAVGTEKS
jgi:HD-GYP domain-containing protein (c-di-GMP phosphodiesterase class II)